MPCRGSGRLRNINADSYVNMFVYLEIDRVRINFFSCRNDDGELTIQGNLSTSSGNGFPIFAANAAVTVPKTVGSEP